MCGHVQVQMHITHGQAWWLYQLTVQSSWLNDIQFKRYI